ncbi:hypothetical protein V6N13_074575 [Hibiscus sabdariffa]
MKLWRDAVTDTKSNVDRLVTGHATVFTPSHSPAPIGALQQENIALTHEEMPLPRGLCPGDGTPAPSSHVLIIGSSFSENIVSPTVLDEGQNSLSNGLLSLVSHSSLVLSANNISPNAMSQLPHRLLEDDEE